MLPISSTAPARGAPQCDYGRVPLQQVIIVNAPIPVAPAEATAAPATGSDLAARLRTVVNVAALAIGATVVFWSFGRPVFTSAAGASPDAAEPPADAPDPTTPSPAVASFPRWMRTLMRAWG